MDCEEGIADKPIIFPCPSSIRDITACEATPAIPQPRALPIIAKPMAKTGPTTDKSIIMYLYTS
ncbi:Uncharacterised protein [Chlamydia abortus]|nr:Uncharacterised protein [Chlamydia abortus]